MPITLNAMPGSKTANSFVTAIQAEAHFASLYPGNNKWASFTDSDAKVRLLISASKDISAVIAWHTPLLDCDLYSNYPQALVWPWALYPNYYLILNPENGTANSFTSSILETYRLRTFAGGSVFVYYAPDHAAPEGEIAQISSFTKATNTITLSSSLTAALTSQCQIVLMFPPPQWLIEAVCEQALFIAKGGAGYAEEIAAGVRSKSENKSSVSLIDTGRWGRLCAAAQQLIKDNAPPPSTEVIRS